MSAWVLGAWLTTLVALVAMLAWPRARSGYGRLIARSGETVALRVGLVRHEERSAGYVQRSILLTVVGDGLYVEADIGDGHELTFKLYDARVWVLTPEAER